MEDVVDEIKSRCNIVDVIGQAVSLKKTGGNYKGLCPFHNEKTPSFSVSDSKQMFYCFGCGASGDVFEFVQRYYNLDFPAALEKLAGQYGVDIKGSYFKPGKKEELYELNRMAARFFYNSFSNPGSPGLEYMRKRGIEGNILKKFGIGYADGEWDSLYKYFMETGADIQQLISLGLVTGSNGKYYDRYRDRVIFPIINTGGKVIGFGGRALGDTTPKYLNSSESVVFSKKNNLFGLNLTRQDISKENRAILVEGYMDVISLYQYGVRNVVASLGTALTENQARLIKRYTSNVTVSYDADEAGRAAALRGMEILYREGLKPKTLDIPSGKDPDDYVKTNGKQEFLKAADRATAYIDYRLGTIEKKYDIAETEGKIAFIKESVAFLKTLSPVEAATYIKTLSKNTGVSADAITLELNGGKAERPPGQNNFRAQGGGGDKPPDSLERNLIKLIVSSRDYFERIRPFEQAFRSRHGLEIYKFVESNYAKGAEDDVTDLADELEGDCFTTFMDIMENVSLAGKEEQILSDCVNKIELGGLVEKEKEIVLKLSMADESGNAAQIDGLTRELMEVQTKIQNKKN